jgi:hypothetical protein
MDSYTITIAPNDDSGNSTTLVVDTTGDQVRITDVHLHAAGGLSGGTMPTVDFGLLLRAVGTSPSGRPAVGTAPADVPAPADAAAPAGAGEQTSGGIGESGSVDESRLGKTPRPRRGKRATAAPTVAEPKPSRRRVPTAASDGAGARRGRTAATPAKKGAATKTAGAKTATAGTGGGRAYRRMPEDFRAVYQDTSSPSAIADHYGVPRHTAQGWIRRIKAGA